MLVSGKALFPYAVCPAYKRRQDDMPTAEHGYSASPSQPGSQKTPLPTGEAVTRSPIARRARREVGYRRV